MRYTGPVRFDYHGNKAAAQQYATAARTMIGAMLASQQTPYTTRSALFDNGVRVTITVVSQPEGPDRDRVSAPIAAAWGGRYLVSAHIYAPQALEAEDAVRKVYQYQFVYANPAGEFWQSRQPPGSAVSSGGSAVGVVFVLHEETVSYAAFPLVSTTKEPPQDEPDAWPYIQLSDIDVDITPWAKHLPVPRYEVGHATGDHVLLDGEKELLHTAWMRKGHRHYMAGASTPSTLRQLGTLNTAVDYVGQIPAVYLTDSPAYGHAPTDVGYEAALEVYQPPEKTEPYDGEVTPGNSHTSAADADWYTSYGVYRAEFDGEVRDFGVMIDANQVLHAWPLDAEGTGAPDPTYINQKIKTNVDPAYVKSAQLSFPPGVRFHNMSYRDSVPNYPDTNSFFDGPLEDSTRYKWHPSPDGSQYLTIVERESPGLVVERHDSGPVGADPVYFDDEREYRIPDPAVAAFEIEIEPFGFYLGDFNLSVSPVTVVGEPADSFTPVQARFAQEGAFQDVSLGEPLVAGFEARRLSEDVDSWNFVQYLAGDAPPPFGSWPVDAAHFLNCQAIELSSLPAPLTATWEYNGNPPFAHYQYAVPPYMRQDMPFARLTEFATDNIWQQMVVPYTSSFILEGRFVVRKLDGTEVFSKCCRKYKPNDHGFGNFFTAKVASLDISTGSVVFGLCESATYITSVDTPVGRFPGPSGAAGNWYPHEGRNKSDKGYAVFHRGRLVESSWQPLSAQLDTELDSYPMDKNLSFWGGLRPSTVSVVPPLASGLFAFTSSAFNTQYIDHLLNDVGLNPIEVANGMYGVRDFPWGLEMYSWFAQNHFSHRQIEDLVAGDDIIAFTGVYTDVQGEVAIQPMSNEVVNAPEVSARLVDTIHVGTERYTHAQMYEEAFGEPAGVDFNVELVNEVRSPTDLGGNDVGYPYRTTTGSPGNWDSELIYAPFAVYKDAADNPVYAAHLLATDTRVYCGIDTLPAAIVVEPGFDPDQDPVGARQRNGVRQSPFVAKAFGTVEIEDGD